ncbi:MAG: AbrB/MazE/SpoVT family DNA-binding domain-containing protein [Candidatus Aenigmarchaeota archaeon]|nr:AbrB/MazE/SpoVT family DNA-binding domain-containing protein [Candidatus Aenigmarchaeota archaeon]
MKKVVEIPELTKISSKGQVVIPSNVRNRLNIKEGSVMAVMTKGDIIVLKKLDSGIKAEDLATLKLVEEAWEDVERGRYKVRSRDAFFRELKKW